MNKFFMNFDNYLGVDSPPEEPYCYKFILFY